jgi:hypothetical protein
MGCPFINAWRLPQYSHTTFWLAIHWSVGAWPVSSLGMLCGCHTFLYGYVVLCQELLGLMVILHLAISHSGYIVSHGQQQGEKVLHSACCSFSLEPAVDWVVLPAGLDLRFPGG